MCFQNTVATQQSILETLNIINCPSFAVLSMPSLVTPPASYCCVSNVANEVALLPWDFLYQILSWKVPKAPSSIFVAAPF